MFTLSDAIEEYIKKLLSLSPRLYVDIQRHELAGKYSCAPSQINYVLNSRFSLERGYLVESRRGGKGFIRIYRLDPLRHQAWKEIIAQVTSVDFDSGKALQFLKRGSEEKIITWREARMLQALLNDELYTGLTAEEMQLRDLKNKLFKAALAEVFKVHY